MTAAQLRLTAAPPKLCAPETSTNSRSAGWGAASSCCGVPLATIRPSSNMLIRSAMRKVEAMSCEMTTEVTPKSSAVRRIISSTFLVAMGSRPVVGSS